MHKRNMFKPKHIPLLLSLQKLKSIADDCSSRLGCFLAARPFAYHIRSFEICWIVLALHGRCKLKTDSRGFAPHLLKMWAYLKVSLQHTRVAYKEAPSSLNHQGF